MTNDEARELYKESGITYKSIGSKEISKLIYCIKTELHCCDNELELKLCPLRKNDINYNEDGSIKNCYLMVDGDYFKRREAISFNTADIHGNEFIGFAGWGGTKQREPLLKAFAKWINEMM
jgi:hypothetical protein